MNLEQEIIYRLKTEEIEVKETARKQHSSKDLLENHYRTMIFNFLPDISPLFRIKNELLGLGYIDRDCIIRSGFRYSHPKNIFILENTFINYSCTLLANSLILIGKNVAIGPNVSIYCINHHLTASKEFESERKPVYIDDNAWIGGGSIILPGVKIAKATVIGAGSVVTKSTEESHLYAGVPAKKIRKIN